MHASIRLGSHPPHDLRINMVVRDGHVVAQLDGQDVESATTVAEQLITPVLVETFGKR